MSDDLQPTGPLPLDQVTGVVHCGGASRRMGQDKAALRMGSVDLLDRAVNALTPHVHEVVLACGVERRYGDRGLRLVLDDVPDGGPLGGLRAGLSGAGTEWVLVLACDMPAAAELVEGLLAAARPGDQVVHYTVTKKGRQLPEPLCALYHRSVLAAIDAQLARGEHRMISFWSRVSVRALPASSQDPFRNMNTPEDLACYREADPR